MLKKFLLIAVLIIFTGCQTSYKPLFEYDPKQQVIKFQIDERNEYQVGVRSFKFQPRHSSSLFSAYTLYDDINAITIEHIHISNESKWNGEPQSLYIRFAQEQLKIKKMELLNEESFGNFDFLTYLVDEKSLVYIVSIWDGPKNTFIYDAKGLLYNKLIKKFIPSYENSFDNTPSYGKPLQKSLVFYNSLYNYFN